MGDAVDSFPRRTAPGQSSPHRLARIPASGSTAPGRSVLAISPRKRSGLRCGYPIVTAYRSVPQEPASKVLGTVADRVFLDAVRGQDRHLPGLRGVLAVFAMLSARDWDPGSVSTPLRKTFARSWKGKPVEITAYLMVETFGRSLPDRSVTAPPERLVVGMTLALHCAVDSEGPSLSKATSCQPLTRI
jgi:hypothetical protein